jgi:hypothetical protein
MTCVDFLSQAMNGLNAPAMNEPSAVETMTVKKSGRRHLGGIQRSQRIDR